MSESISKMIGSGLALLGSVAVAAATLGIGFRVFRFVAGV